MEHAATDLDLTLQDVYELACTGWLAARGEGMSSQPPSAYPHGDEILAGLGAMLARSPEDFTLLLASQMSIPPEHLLELRRLATAPEKKRQAK
jgi:hypothetical protein